MTPEERAALEWLDAQLHGGTVDHVRALKRLLARPVMPEEPLVGHITEMVKAAWVGAVDPLNDTRARRDMQAAYYALYAHLTKPATKEVEVWRVEWSYRAHAGNWVPAGRSEPTKAEADAYADRLDSQQCACIRVTGPHKQLVPSP